MLTVSGLCPSSRIQNARENNVSETGSVSIHRRWGGGGENLTLLGPLERANLFGKNRSVSKHCVFLYLEFWMMGRILKPSNSD
jgi:hypothetical protein